METKKSYKVGDIISIHTMDGDVIGNINEVFVLEGETFYNVESVNGKMYQVGDALINDKANSDRVNHPAHYQLPNGIEVLDIVKHMDFCLGNAIKYILRSSKKQEQGYSQKEKTVEDLKKAVFYINEKIQMLQEGDLV